MISAVPGTRKTQALKYFKNSVMPQARIHTAVAGEGTPWGVACQLMELLEIGVPNSRDLLGSRRRISEEIGDGGVLMVDEAQHLVQRNPRGKDNWDALEWLRTMAEEGFFSLVFCGDLGLLETAHRLPQLWRRMRRRVIIKSVAKADVETLCMKRGISNVSLTAIFFHVARRGGGLGDVDNAISHARLLSGGEPLDKAHVMAALEDLKLAPKGGLQ